MATHNGETTVLRSGEVAEILGVSPVTVWKWYQRGKLLPDFVTPGGSTRYYQTSIDKFLEELANKV
ncbi:putative DNA-binding transcriptional regulator AlpA [Lipingzhangella halophila]|uniref:Putative DNA-binding transcriptional regulator AlpA n=1 Tax=Lipingzhangella halophila TaxID=1783352 RepID=A0A7W7RN00_9ACTN|nr:putative DNA-binding transcriptional regulator AlpA [Lipingzhangella halophila]